MSRSNLFKICFLIFFFLLVLPPDLLQGTLKYNFSYNLKGATHGKILFIIPFRVHYQSFASVNFRAEKSIDSGYNFYFSDIPEPGYMMRTSGFSGKTLVILTSGYDFNQTLNFSNKKLKEFMNTVPYYAKFIKRKKAFLFQIYPNDQHSLQFKRDGYGQHREEFYDFKLQFQYFPEILNIDFNIYKILVEMIRAYNHSFLADLNIEEIKLNPKKTWLSPSLDYSENINRIVRLAARVMNRLKRFKQRESFRLKYRVMGISPSLLEIGGNAEPNVPVWGEYAIRKFSRKVVLRTADNVLIEDSFYLKIKNPAGNGLEAKISLRLID